MTRTRLIPSLMLLLALSACAPMVHVEQDPAARFGEYRSFAWTMPEREPEVEDPILDSEILDRRVERAVRQSLVAKGLVEAPFEEADLLITYHTASRERLRSYSSGPRFGFGFGVGSGGYHHTRTSIHFGSGLHHGYRYDADEVGSLIVDVIDASTRQLIWRGWENSRVTQYDFSEAQVLESVQQIFEKFPTG